MSAKRKPEKREGGNIKNVVHLKDVPHLDLSVLIPYLFWEQITCDFKYTLVYFNCIFKEEGR